MFWLVSLLGTEIIPRLLLLVVADAEKLLDSTK
jgi:hypothetical protein